MITRGTPRPDGKILIIGGGIANFTNVASTFKGIIRALKQYQKEIQAHKVKIFVRRGGPNYQEGLKAMRLLGETLGVEIQVFGPDTHITEIVPLALGAARPSAVSHTSALLSPTPRKPNGALNGHDHTSPMASVVPSRAPSPSPPSDEMKKGDIVSFDKHDGVANRPWYRPFDENTRSLVFGLQPRAIQGMLDFDFSCGREMPSVTAMIYPFGGHHVQK